MGLAEVPSHAMYAVSHQMMRSHSDGADLCYLIGLVVTAALLSVAAIVAVAGEQVLLQPVVEGPCTVAAASLVVT